MTQPCHWPFHNQPACKQCAEYERLYGEGVDEWLIQKQEIRQAARAAKAAQLREPTPRGVSAPVQPDSV